LRQGAGAEAAAEFRKLLEHKGVLLISSFNPPTNLYPLAHLGSARAAALAGDTAASRKAYQDFFAFWRAADPDIPVRQEAEREYANLK
ncbi:MAG TPA: hypothetical protein VGV38_02460, partial [Pyrinomonadaceae bacterium]|nr:hypothetical protein [Pyrinomonadaceae bacterium]